MITSQHKQDQTLLAPVSCFLSPEFHPRKSNNEAGIIILEAWTLFIDKNMTNVAHFKEFSLEILKSHQTPSPPTVSLVISQKLWTVPLNCANMMKILIIFVLSKVKAHDFTLPT